MKILARIINKINKSIHPIFDILLDSIINSDYNRKVILLPRRYDIVAWTALWYAAFQLLNKSENTDYNNLSFEKGQKVLFNGVVCKFVSIDLEAKTISLSVKTSKKSEVTHTVPLSKVAKLLPVGPEVPLTITKSWLANIEPIDNPLVADISSSIDIAVITNSNLFNTAYEKIKKTYNEVYSLINCAKLNNDGELTSLDNKYGTGIPACLLSSDVFRLYNFIDSYDILPEYILIDGSKHVLDDMSQFQEMILEKEIPTTVFIEHNEYRNIKNFRDLGFQIIKEEQWNSNLQLSSRTHFNYINHMFRTADNLNISPVVFPNNNLLKAFSMLKDFFSIYRHAGNKIGEIWNEMFYDLYLTALSVIQTEQNINDRTQELTRLFGNHSSYYTLISAQKLINEEKQRLKNQNEKAQYIRDFIKTQAGVKTAVVVKNDYELKKCWDYWRDVLKNNLKYVEIVTPRAFLKGYKPYEKIIITGYLGRKSLNQIIRSYSCDDIYVLLWEHEMKNYFTSYLKSFNKTLSNNRIVQQKTDLLSVSLTPSEIQLINKMEPDKIEFRLNYNLYRNFVATKNDSNVDEAILIEFEGGFYGFFTPSYPFYKISSSQINKGEINTNMLSKTDAKGLEDGDRVIYIRSSSEKIREIVDQELKENNYFYLRETAELWQRALRTKYREKHGNFDELYRVLKRHGLKRNKITVKNWLNRGVIGPANLDDIDIIANATDYQPLKNSLLQVKDSILRLRSAHIQAFSILENEILQNINDSYNQIASGIEIDYRRKLYQSLVVKRFSKKLLKVKKAHVNKIYEGKESYLWQG
ncbi:DrmE family protein [Lihuaxuella thermophila]|uniref:DISARM protein DrmE C-terminal domain-containing protein n=1 Tax=Lihuaxuella thermophila TaxID=1173111 RepID=A0A1H8EHK8_9BACL|nr:DrmE family protein [Lihuaxuella thermophila]SEN19061.1 hypothetical protein SAMN05444955_1073 [Lihuaxuella thermophila]